MDAAVTLRAPTFADLDAIVAVYAAQDRAWWDEVDLDADDVRAELDRVVAAVGSLEAGARLALVDEAVVGIGLHVGHGHTNLAIDPSSLGADQALASLTAWLVGTGAELFDVPTQDSGRLALVASHGFVPVRSSFDLERAAPADDLGPTVWPTGIGPAPFTRGTDDVEVHDMIYSVWTDVPGHTHRPIDEWRALFLGGPAYDGDLIVLARRATGEAAGIAVCRVFGDEIGWVAQLAVGRPDRGVGLGRALLVEALHRLSSTGVPRLGLSVEAQNATALGLYRSVGLAVSREWVHCGLASTT